MITIFINNYFKKNLLIIWNTKGPHKSLGLNLKSDIDFIVSEKRGVGVKFFNEIVRQKSTEVRSAKVRKYRLEDISVC